MYKKILLIGTSYEGKGGIAILLKIYLQLFANVSFVCSHKFANKWNQLWIAFIAIFKVIYYLVFTNIQIVHIHTASYRSFFKDSLYLLIAKLFNKKVILHLHGGEFEKFYSHNKKYCNWICHKADCIVGVSKYFGNLFERLDLNKEIKVIYNAVDKPLYSKKELSNPTLNILFLGTIDENKGIFDTIECFAKHIDYFQDKVILHICGVGDSERLTAMIEKYQLHNNIKYHGWVNYQEKNRLLSISDIYIQPSYFESLGIAIIEAMGYGIPIVASRTGGIPELVETGKNGILITPGSTDELFNALSSLIEDSSLRQKMGECSLKSSTQFTLEKMESDIVELYKSLLL